MMIFFFVKKIDVSGSRSILCFVFYSKFFSKISGILISPSATVSREAQLTGTVTVHDHAIIHPLCHLNGEAGPITILAGCVIEENVVITAPVTGLTIGPTTAIEVGAIVRGTVGEASVVEVKGVVEAGARVGNGCVVGVGATVLEELQDGHVVFGPLNRVRKDPLAAAVNAERTTKLAQLLATLMPEFHFLQKPEAT
jgi:carbonic anhydrase/acetyltransferase-like protein (isoleucine patch superfamily)